jgi:hypothetical protein
MNKVKTELSGEERPLDGVVGSLERLLLVGPDAIHASADGAHRNYSAVRRDMQALMDAVALVQRRAAWRRTSA